MYFYYVDVSKLKDNKTKLDLREEFEKCGWELFSVNYGFNWFFREFAVGYDGAIKPDFPPLPPEVRISEESFYPKD